MASTVNGVTWSAPAPQSVTLPGPDVGGRLASQLAEAPALAERQKADIAESKARTAQAPLELDARKAQLQQQQLAADDAMLQRLGPVLTGPMGAQAYTSPHVRAALEPILQRRGMEWPADPSQLASIVSPQKPFTQWTQDEISKAMAAPPGQRQLPPDAPQWLHTAPARVPISAAGVENIVKGLSGKEKLLSDPKNGYTPKQFLADVKVTQQRLRAAGMDGDADALNEYLSPDGTTLNDAFRERHVGELYQAEIDKLHKLGLKWDTDAKYKEEREKDLRDQFSGKMQFNYANLASHEKTAYANGLRADKRVAIAQGNLDARVRSIDNAAARYDASKNSRDFAIYKGVVQQATTELDNAQKTLDSVTQQINNMSQNHKLRNSPAYQSLVDQASRLKDFIDTQGPVLRARQADASNQMIKTYETVSGHQVTGGQQSPTGQQPMLRGRPIRPNAAGTGWVFFDGSKAE